MSYGASHEYPPALKAEYIVHDLRRLLRLDQPAGNGRNMVMIDRQVAEEAVRDLARRVRELAERSATLSVRRPSD